MSDCSICCIFGTTPAPSIVDPCVCNAGVGATFYGTDGELYIRFKRSSPCSNGDWKRWSIALDMIDVFQDEALVTGALPSNPLIDSTSGGGTNTTFEVQNTLFSIVNPALVVKHFHVHVVSSGTIRLANMVNANVVFLHQMSVDDGVSYLFNSAQVVLQDTAGLNVGYSRVLDIPPNSSQTVRMKNTLQIYNGQADVTLTRINYSYQAILIPS